MVHAARVPATRGGSRGKAAALRRRLAFLQEPASFFYDGDRPPAAEDLDDPFRRGATVVRATSRAELAWLRDTLASLEGVGG